MYFGGSVPPTDTLLGWAAAICQRGVVGLVGTTTPCIVGIYSRHSLVIIFDLAFSVPCYLGRSKVFNCKPGFIEKNEVCDFCCEMLMCCTLALMSFSRALLVSSVLFWTSSSSGRSRSAPSVLGSRSVGLLKGYSAGARE